MHRLRCGTHRILLAAGLVAGIPLPGFGQAPSEADKPLTITLSKRFEIGGERDKGVSLGIILPWMVAGTPQGKLLILDPDDRQVLVIDSTGNLIQRFGKGGGGPGEFLIPTSLSVSPDGHILVADAGKRAIVRFDSTGRVLTEERLNTRPIGIAEMATGFTVLVEGSSGLSIDRVSLGSGGRWKVLAETPPARPIAYRNCPVGVPGRPLFSHSIRWAASSSRLAFAPSIEYDVQVLDAATRSAPVHARRRIPPLTVTESEALASQEIAQGLMIRWGTEQCFVPRAELLRARGFARQRSPIVALALSPDGDLWVRRLHSAISPGSTDIFSSAGVYRGTIDSPDIPFPVTFMSPTRMVSISSDRSGLSLVTVYDIRFAP
ncbi:MAG: 6-bladed beta-propeller [Gemmatimonadales bacterium]|nr:6-bladed beta-propeller [Gemmatimonadales bacterium]